MQLFRSEEHISRWSEANGAPVGARLTIDQQWHLATTWYADRLQRGARRRSAAEAEAEFARIGLTGRFWSFGAYERRGE